MKKLLSNSPLVLALLGIFLFVFITLLFTSSHKQRQYPEGRAMMKLIEAQLKLEPRHVGGAGHDQLKNMIVTELSGASLAVERQSWRDESGQQLENIVGRFNPDATKRVIVATHYDTKAEANLDRKTPAAAVPGANDGASGVAVLISLARELSNRLELKDVGVDLVFFDAEEFEPGPFNNWRPRGSSYFADHILDLYPAGKPELAIVPDLVCKDNLRLLKDQGSYQNAPELTNRLWSIGQSVDNSIFIDKGMGEVKDDHTPLNAIGIPSVVLIDLNYPDFHTTQDTLDKCSPRSLEAVQLTIKKFLVDYDRNL